MKKIIDVSLKCLKKLYDFVKHDKSILEDKSLAILIQECVIWCFNLLNEIINSSTLAKGISKPTKEELRKNDIVRNKYIKLQRSFMNSVL